MLGTDGRLYDSNFDFDGDGKLNAYEYSVMDDVVFGHEDTETSEVDELEDELSLAGLDATELNVMTRQCLSRRISTLDKLKCELSAWEMERNRDTAKIQWHFQTGDAREKLISLYPTLSSVTF